MRKRKALLRCLVDKVVLDRGERDVALVRIVWRGGATTELDVKMSVNAVAALTRGHEMHERLLDLARAKMHDDEIAAILTDEGHRSPNCGEQGLADHRSAAPARRRDQDDRAAHPMAARA